MAEPVVKWVGGKRKLLPQLSPLLPPAEQIHHYAEPFVGGGAMLFHVLERWPAQMKRLFRLYANDSNARLMSFYRALATHPAEVAAFAARLASAHDTVKYRQASALLNSLLPFIEDRRRLDPSLEITHAATFLYLNKCGFNGLYRENARGDFNVPANPKATWKPSGDALAETLRKAASALSPCALTCMPADVFIDDQLVVADGVIHPECVFFFVDPPYLNEAEDGFVGYGRKVWTRVDLMALSLQLDKIHEAGCRFMLTHADTTLVRELFTRPDYNLTPIVAKQTISQAADGRGLRAELVIRNYL